MYKCITQRLPRSHCSETSLCAVIVSRPQKRNQPIITLPVGGSLGPHICFRVTNKAAVTGSIRRHPAVLGKWDAAPGTGAHFLRAPPSSCCVALPPPILSTAPGSYIPHSLYPMGRNGFCQRLYAVAIIIVLAMPPDFHSTVNIRTRRMIGRTPNWRAINPPPPPPVPHSTMKAILFPSYCYIFTRRTNPVFAILAASAITPPSRITEPENICAPK